MDRKHCTGCYDDFYNIKGECWMLEKAQVIPRKRVGIDEVPPWTREPENLPNCYRQPRVVFVEPTRER